jgi:hypothetical protein
MYDSDDVEEGSEDEDWTPKHENGDNGSATEEWNSKSSYDEGQPHKSDEEDIDGMDMDMDYQGALEYEAFIDTLHVFVTDEQKDNPLNLPDGPNESKVFSSEDKSPSWYEHIAGTACKCKSGYSGDRVTAQEMRSCKTLQCLVPKPADWKSEPDDLEVERTSRFFLTGISDHCPSREWDTVRVTPERHCLQRPEFDVRASTVCSVHKAHWSALNSL